MYYVNCAAAHDNDRGFAKPVRIAICASIGEARLVISRRVEPGEELFAVYRVVDALNVMDADMKKYDLHKLMRVPLSWVERPEEGEGGGEA